MVMSDRFHQESGVLAAYEEAEAALWRALDPRTAVGVVPLACRPGESVSTTVQRIARAIADAVIRSDPDEFAEDLTTVPGISVEQGTASVSANV